MPQQPSLKNKEHFILDGVFGSAAVSAVSKRISGNMSLFYGGTAGALDNRKEFLEDLGVNYKFIVCAKQIHGSSIKYVKARDIGSGALSYDTAIADTDALVTDVKNLALAVFTADCLPVFLYDPKTPAIGLAHAGWRSSKENISAKTIQLMVKLFKTKPGDLRLAFGPCMRSCCYEVGVEFKEQFSQAVIERNGRLYLDLVSQNKKQALECGVSKDNIFDCNLCTACRNDVFFSFRKEDKRSGRMISVLMLK
jgi:YfiH family protein